MLRIIYVEDNHNRERRVNVNYIIEYYACDNGTQIRLVDDNFWTPIKPEQIDKMLYDKNQQDKDALDYAIHKLTRGL